MYRGPYKQDKLSDSYVWGATQSCYKGVILENGLPEKTGYKKYLQPKLQKELTNLSKGHVVSPPHVLKGKCGLQRERDVLRKNGADRATR